MPCVLLTKNKLEKKKTKNETPTEGIFLPFNTILLTILLVNTFYKLFCKVTSRVLETRVPSKELKFLRLEY